MTEATKKDRIPVYCAFIIKVGVNEDILLYIFFMAVKMPDRTVRAVRHLIRIIFFSKILITQS